MFNYKQADESQLEFVAVAETGDLPPGERLFLEIDQKPIVVLNIGGELLAIADMCSHDQAPIGDGEIEGCEIVCPRHGARFDLNTGKVLSLPALTDIPVYPVRIVEGKIEIGIPLEG